MSIATSTQQTPAADPAGAAPTGAALRLVETAEGDDHARHRNRNAFREQEHDLQGYALAVESLCLRRRAERYVLAIERGAVLTDEQVDSVLRAFRAYRPFLFEVDRARNDVARRRLSQAVSGSRTHRARREDAAETRDVSVA